MAAAVDQGYGQVLTYRGMADVDRAQDVRRGIYRCARHRGISAEAGPAALVDQAEVMGISRERDGTYTLRFRVWSKTQGRRAHLQNHGTDRGGWPYDPRRPATEDERDSWANRNELNQPVYHDS